MKKNKKLIIACDGESASGKSTASKLGSKKYSLMLVNSGLFYRYGSKLILKHNPKKIVPFLKKKFQNLTYKTISKENLHSEKISNHVAFLAKNKKVREIVNRLQKRIIRSNKRICVEGRDIASKVLAKNPKYDLAFYFQCNLNISSYRRWLELKKKVSLKEVKKSLKKRTQMDKKRKNSPLIKVKKYIIILADNVFYHKQAS